MKLLIDADSCPVTDIALSEALKENIACLIFCDTAHIIEREHAQTIICSKGTDSADFALLKYAEKNDIVVTGDYGLASLCLVKKARPINQNGLIYTEENINSLLMSRFLSKKARQAGYKAKGPSRRKPEQDEAFKIVLQKLISEAKGL